MKKYFLFAAVFCVNSYAITTCPPEDKVKSVQLIQAFQNPYDPECWNFTSTSFIHVNNTWSVFFGTFLPTATTQQEALEQGQKYFDEAELQIKHPMPVSIPNKTLCDYMPTGMSYWISAVSPP